MMGRNQHTVGDLHNVIVSTHRRNPELSPSLLAQRLGCSHVTVRRVLRAAGLYVRAGSEKPSTPQTEVEMVRVLKASVSAAKRGR